MSASGNRSADKLEEDVAAVLGMRDDVFRTRPKLFFVTRVFGGEKPGIVSAAAAGTGVVILFALFVGFVNFSSVRPTPGNGLKIDLPSDLLAKPREDAFLVKAFSVVVPAERSRPTQRLALGMVASPDKHQESDHGLQKVLKPVAASAKQHLVQDAHRSRSKTGLSLDDRLQTASANSDGGNGGLAIDTERSASQLQEVVLNRPAAPSAQANPQTLNMANKALDNRRSGIDALRALRHQ